MATAAADEPKDQPAAGQIAPALRPTGVAPSLHNPGERGNSRSKSRLVFLAAWPMSHTDSTGTSVLDSRYEAIIEKPTASVSGKNSERPAREG